MRHKSSKRKHQELCTAVSPAQFVDRIRELFKPGDAEMLAALSDSRGRTRKVLGK